ncbi:LytR C-terminal domain-containing protein [Blastococcus sp. SYSU D00669]
MTSVGERTDRPPVRARSGRRPIPPLIFLLVLALAALGVWWNVLRTEETRQAEQEAACTTAQEAAPSMDPTTINLRVLNATDQQGLAGTVASQLQALGFVVDEISNDSSGREVTGVGEIRHGPRGADAARFTTVYLSGATTYEDTRATAVVDVVIGPDFAGLASPEQVAAALSAGASAQAAC